MNAAQISRLADDLEALPSSVFDMTTWGSACGSPACIAGWAIHMATDSDIDVFKVGDVFGTAMALLRLSEDQADALFHAPGVKLRTITKQDAVCCLRLLALTGTVDWTTARTEARKLLR